MRRIAVGLVAAGLAASFLGACAPASPRVDSYWPVGTCLRVSDTETVAVKCSEEHTHVVMARQPVGSACPAGTDTSLDGPDNNFCLRAETVLRSNTP